MPRTTKTLSKNLEKLTTTPKAKAKTSTKSTTTTSKKPQKKPSGNTTTVQKRKAVGSRSKKKHLETIKVMNSRKIEFFPWIETFPIYLYNQTEDKKCWFTCVEHAQKYVDRHKPKYKCYCYTGGGR